MSAHFWATKKVTLCGLVEPSAADGNPIRQCQECHHIAAGHEYRGDDPRVLVAAELARANREAGK